MISEQASFLNPVDMTIVMVVALVVFGPKRLPEVGRQLGQAIRELKKLTSELTDSLNTETQGIKTAFDSVSPYTVISAPPVTERKLPAPVEGYSNADPMGESPLLADGSEGGSVADDPSTTSERLAAAMVPLAPVRPRSGDDGQ